MPEAHSLPAVATAAVFRFRVTTASGCPVHALHDEFEVEGRRLDPQHGSSVCLVLAADVSRAMILLPKPGEPDLQAPYTFSCSGCGGMISVTTTSRLHAQGLDDKQQHRVEALTAALRKIPLFQSLDEGALRKVIPEMKAGDFVAGDIVVRQGENGKHLYVIETGSVDVLSGKDDSVLLTTLRAGEVFGEMSLLGGMPCSATIRVRESGRLLAIDGGIFTRLVGSHPSLQEYLFRLLTQRLRGSNALKEAQLAKGIRGSLGDLQLVELLQTLHTAGKTGQLLLSVPKGQATISLRTGGLVGIDYARRSGPEALYELLKENVGSFSFSPVLPADYAQRPEIGDMMGLLMEGLVRIDESLRGSAPDTGASRV